MGGQFGKGSMKVFVGHAVKKGEVFPCMKEDE